MVDWREIMGLIPFWDVLGGGDCCCGGLVG